MTRGSRTSAPRRALAPSAADLEATELDQSQLDADETVHGTRFAQAGDSVNPDAQAFVRTGSRRVRFGALGVGVLALALTGGVIYANSLPNGTTAAEPAAAASTAVPASASGPAGRPSSMPGSVSRDLTRQPLVEDRSTTPTPTSTAPKPSAPATPSAAPSTTATKKPAPSPAPSSEAPTQIPLGPVIGERYATTALNVRTSPTQNAGVIKTIETGTKVSITAKVQSGFRQISVSGAPAWVKDQYLSKTKPSSDSGSGSGSGSISMAACASGSGVESGLVSNAIKVHRAVCAKWPSITSYGGVRGTGDFHGTGQALDIMVSGATGWEVAKWVRANAAALGVTEVIYSQQIWTTQRSGEGWRPMSDRGSSTANHYDHVHVSVR